jgi:hypothetical protein
MQTKVATGNGRDEVDVESSNWFTVRVKTVDSLFTLHLSPNATVGQLRQAVSISFSPFPLLSLSLFFPPPLSLFLFSFGILDHLSKANPKQECSSHL